MYPSQMGKYECVLTLSNLNAEDSYPVPRADGLHHCLAGKQILDLRSTYWQFPMHQFSIKKTDLSPGPGYGLWEFVVMQYGLTGATQTCQRGLDEIFCECHDCVNNYEDDIIIIVFSVDIHSHKEYLRRVLG